MCFWIFIKLPRVDNFTNDRSSTNVHYLFYKKVSKSEWSLVKSNARSRHSSITRRIYMTILYENIVDQLLEGVHACCVPSGCATERHDMAGARSLFDPVTKHPCSPRFIDSTVQNVCLLCCYTVSDVMNEAHNVREEDTKHVKIINHFTIILPLCDYQQWVWN